MSTEPIRCPNCKRTEGLILLVSGNSSLRVPIKKGKISPSKTISLDLKIAGIKTFSLSNYDTRVIFYPDEGLEGELHCSKCNKAFIIPITRVE